MERGRLLAICKKIVRFIVYACEGDQYLAMMEDFRHAGSRKAWVDAICTLIRYGLSQTDDANPLAVTQHEWQEVCRFIQCAKIEEVRQLHVETMRYIATVELEKIYEMEQYIASVLQHLEAEEEG